MAKNQSAAVEKSQATSSEAAAPSNAGQPAGKPSVAIPAGLRRFTGDVLGFHDPETDGPIHGIPRGAKLSDSQLEADKPSAFVIFECLAETSYTEGSGDEQTTGIAKKGEMVGVWMKGGMRGIRNLCGLEVYMVHTGEKRLKGRPAAQSPMKTYDFHVGKGTPRPIPIIEDNREKSAGRKTFLDPKVKAAPGREPGDDSDDDSEVGF